MNDEAVRRQIAYENRGRVVPNSGASITPRQIPEDVLHQLGIKLAWISSWIDEAPANKARDGEAQTWGRLAKLAEETGEVITAFIGVTGQNPRKGFTHNYTQVLKELLDTAVTALCAYEHMTNNGGHSIGALVEHIMFVEKRADGD